MSREDMAIALSQGLIVESEDGSRYIAEEHMAGGLYGMWSSINGWHIAPKLTNSLDEALAFIS